ncbi:MAG TPA: gliding motility-associated C-terminal domain-containing protein [Puia sp.]|nr:gliding motility-associated C-terminal domain-containing protein [Puia sp.]
MVKSKNCSRILFAAFLLPAGLCVGQPVVTVAITNPTCAYNNGSFVVTATGGTPPYSYVSNAARENNSTGVFGELAAGTYDLTVRDDKGKQTTTSVVLTGPGTFPYFNSAVVNATGCNANNGQVTLTAAGGTPPYQYSINDGVSFQSGNVFSNLAPGSYPILIEDANGCITAPWSATGVSYADFQLWAPVKFVNVGTNCSLAMSVTPSAPGCGNNNAIKIGNTSGGTAPYLYSLDGGAFGPLAGGGFSGLSSGEHTVTVEDATGLKSTYTYTFPNDCAITTSQTPSQCGGNTGTLTVTGASGIPPLSYSIDGINFQAGATFNNLAKGTYTILVKDGHGVVTYGSGNVTAVCFSAIATAVASQCNLSTGGITAQGVNGFPAYSYSIDGVNFQPSGVFTNLKGGYYTVTATDSHGQTAKTTVAVGDLCINLSVNTESATCGNSNGSISVAASNGTSPYQYSISAGNFYQPGNEFPGLAGGNYTVTVKDANGNLAVIPAAIENIQGAQIAAIPKATSCLNNNGTIQITTTGGTPPFNASLDGGASNAGQTSWTGLDSGTHSIAITDGNGCQTSTTVLVPLTDTLTVTAGSVPATCQGVGVTLPVTSNGAGFTWAPADGLSSATVAEPVAQPTATTTYTVTATTGRCADTASVVVTVLPAPVAVAGASDTMCPGKSVQLQGSGGVQYVWSPAVYLSDSTSPDPMVEQPVSTLTYHLKVKGANGCSSVDSAETTVVVTLPPKVSAGNDTAVVIGQPLQLNAVDVDSSGFTSYVWSPGEGLSDPDIADPTTVITASVTYTVVATTPSGCSATGTIVIGAATTTGIIVPNAFTPNNGGRNDLLKVNAFGVQLKYFRVYNRWGQLVFATSDAGSGWDGSIGGQPAVTGAYIWMAAAVDDHGRPVERNGTVILIR